MRSVLVLDDPAEARAMIVTALRDGDFDVFEAATGEEALELAQSRVVDLIIANPLIAGMDSDEFALALGVNPVTAGTPVVFSAAADDAHQVWCLAEACNVSHILIKSWEPGSNVARFVGEILGAEPIPSQDVPADPRTADPRGHDDAPGTTPATNTRSQAGWVERAAKPNS
jgi:response regulator RpfG family c-di-GMP phosphodiesterase